MRANMDARDKDGNLIFASTDDVDGVAAFIEEGEREHYRDVKIRVDYDDDDYDRLQFLAEMERGK